MANRLYNKQVTPKGYKAGGTVKKDYKLGTKFQGDYKGKSVPGKVKEFFEQFQQLPSWFTNLWILVVASIFGIKGTQIFRNGGKK